MRKLFFLSVISVLFAHWAKAGKIDTTRVYLTNSGKTVKTKDSADFYRVILLPDTTVDKDLYRVFEYYNNGKIKSVATSLTGTGNLVLDGTCINFFPNGKRRSYIQFKNGIPNGYMTNYYPNGQLYNTVEFDVLYNDRFSSTFATLGLIRINNFNIKIVDVRDSIGNVLVSKGTGHVIIFDPDFKRIIEEGNIKNNKREGEWKGLIADSGKYTITYHKGELKSGMAYLFSGKQYPFTQLESSAVFSDGPEEFGAFIRRNQHYPDAEKRKITGTVTIGFYVETNGTISGVTVVRSLVRSLDEEAVRVISLSPLWIPATHFGIPYRAYYTIGLGFGYN